MSSRRILSVVAIGAAITVVPVILAKTNGTPAGHSGGPAGGGQSCVSCHFFHIGPGGVELSGVDRRYRSGAVYDLDARVFDTTRFGAGFEISVESVTGSVAGSVGLLLVADGVATKYATAGGGTDYITHTKVGYEASVADWSAGGDSFSFPLRWEAPLDDEGPITMYVAANATNDGNDIEGDHYYATHTTLHYAVPGDGDGDTDLDLSDFAVVQRCFSGPDPAIGEECVYVDFDDDGAVALFDVSEWVSVATGPTAVDPAGYVLADAVRGGLLYDKWWEVTGAPEPTGTHALYLTDPNDPGSEPRGIQTGATTFRCKECHGWDYKGRDGAYGGGSHFTDIVGVWGTTLSSKRLFGLLRADPALVPGGHGFAGLGMSDRDLWDVVKMTLEGTIETDDYIDSNGDFIGDEINELLGSIDYFGICSACHDDQSSGVQGTWLNFGTTENPEYIGTVANNKAWEFMHKVRFGHPGSSMSSTELLSWDTGQARNIGMYSSTLPIE